MLNHDLIVISDEELQNASGGRGPRNNSHSGNSGYSFMPSINIIVAPTIQINNGFIITAGNIGTGPITSVLGQYNINS